MQETLYIIQRMRETLYQTDDARVYISDRMHILYQPGCRRLHVYQTADARDSKSDSGCKRHYIRQRMQETISDSECRSLYIRQRMQETISHSGCKRLYIRQRRQESLYQTADARDYTRQQMQESISDSGCQRLYQTGCRSLYIR